MIVITIGKVRIEVTEDGVVKAGVVAPRPRVAEALAAATKTQADNNNGAIPDAAPPTTTRKQRKITRAESVYTPSDTGHGRRRRGAVRKTPQREIPVSTWAGTPCRAIVHDHVAGLSRAQIGKKHGLKATRVGEVLRQYGYGLAPVTRHDATATPKEWRQYGADILAGTLTKKALIAKLGISRNTVLKNLKLYAASRADATLLGHPRTGNPDYMESQRRALKKARAAMRKKEREKANADDAGA
jgi:hypothetical protein